MTRSKKLVIEWKNPPEPKPTKVSLVIAELKKRPGEWALIAENSPAIELMPWWAPIYQNKILFEVRFVYQTNTFSPKDVYARYKGIPEPDPIDFHIEDKQR